MVQPHRVYEDFEPTTEWVQGAGYDTFHVYLPGFKKEQLKVQVTTARNLRIFGERRIGDNKWSRFYKELQIPTNYDNNHISAKFEGGILKIKHPKSIRPAATQLPENELKPQRRRQEEAAQEVPPVAKMDGKENVDNINEHAVSDQKIPEKEKEQRYAKGKNSSPATDGNTSVPGKSSDHEKRNGLAKAGKNTSSIEKHEIGKETGGICMSKLMYYKQVLGGLVTGMKQPRKSATLIAVAGLLVLLLGLYVKRAIRSRESEN